ncbi:hypothetical protein [Krasilnikoviella flava]|uniref:Uncharacterized protein n=1 Tax=Krasilnikoviella flava TaxID=526729 RepID=A0A1T5I6X4_9MICO|nr:hypothetical protein [Krasilnikoviella flava]SKC34936.1 hypothetical protein SAMN04324258_0057 [Krasilnikoviella flava]
MRLRTTTAAAAAALVTAGAALLAPAATAAPAPDTSGADRATAAASWSMDTAAWAKDGDAGGVSIYEQAIKNGTSQYVMGMFEAKGEHLTVWDHHPNDRKAIVRLWVGSSGPAVFYAAGDGTKKEFNLSYDEGQRVYLQACTSTSVNAVCTPKREKGTS